MKKYPSVANHLKRMRKNRHKCLAKSRRNLKANKTFWNYLIVTKEKKAYHLEEELYHLLLNLKFHPHLPRNKTRATILPLSILFMKILISQLIFHNRIYFKLLNRKLELVSHQMRLTQSLTALQVLIHTKSSIGRRQIFWWITTWERW